MGVINVVVPIEDNLIFKKKVSDIEKDDSISKKVALTWEEFTSQKKDYFNGDIIVVTKIERRDKSYIFELGKAKYSDYIYTIKNADFVIFPLYTSIVLKTKDDYYLLIRDNHNKIKFVGGMASLEDFKNETFSPELCIKRELKEEVGLCLDDSHDVINYDRKYLKIPSKDEKIYTCGIIFVGIVNYTKMEFENYFKCNKDIFDDEVSDVLFYTKENYYDLNCLENSGRSLFEIISNMEIKK